MLSAHKIFFHGDKSKVKDQFGGGEGALGNKSGGMGRRCCGQLRPLITASARIGTPDIVIKSIRLLILGKSKYDLIL